MMRRRRFLWGLGLGAGAGVLGGSWGLLHHRSSVVDEQVRELLGDDEGPRQVGLVYLSEVPEERDADTLREQLGANLGWSAAVETDVRGALDRQIRRDFASANTVFLNGWILSRTEARLCALAALAATP